MVAAESAYRKLAISIHYHLSNPTTELWTWHVATRA
jgi:hypothetical protein